MSPQPPPDKEVDFSHFFDNQEQKIQQLEAAYNPPPSRFALTKRFYLLVGVLVVLIGIQILVALSFRAPKPQPVKKQTKAVNSNTKSANDKGKTTNTQSKTSPTKPTNTNKSK